MKRRLTDEVIASLPRKPKRYICYDTVVPGFGVRVGKRKTFVVVGRLNGEHSTRRSIGPVSKWRLEQARERARQMQLRPNSRTFADVAEEYFRHITRLRRHEEVERAIRRELFPTWANRPIADISKRDVIAAVDRKSSSAAHHLFADIRRLMNWACARDYLEHSPCDRIKPSTLIGPKVVRTRVLTDEEIRRVWRAADQMGTYGRVVKLLLLTGQRKSEIANAKWSEINFENATLTISADRFKSNSSHVVPLTQPMIALLPERRCEYVFTISGHSPVKGWSKAKRRLDRLSGVEDWVLHDLRRTVRTNLAALRVPDHVAEMVIGHGRKGLARIYDQHRYVAEMREALMAWNKRLYQIVTCR